MLAIEKSENAYLKNLHQEGLNGFAFVNHSFTSYLQSTDFLWINIIFFKKWTNNSHAENFKNRIEKLSE